MSLFDRLRRPARVRPLATGRLVPRIARLTALALVSLGWRPYPTEHARAAPPDPDPTPSPEPCAAPTTRIAARPGARPTPPRLVMPTTRTPLAELFDATLLEAHVNRGAWPSMRARLLGDTSVFARRAGASPLWDAIEAHLKDPAATTTTSARDLLALALAERHPDVALVGWAFRVARPIALRADLDRAAQDELAALFAEASRHARIHQAIVETLAETGPVTFRPWMSKAAPRPEWSGVEVPDGFWPALEARLPTAGAGTWDEPALDLTIVAGGAGARLLAWGEARPLVDGAPLQLARLDLVRAGAAPLVLAHPTLGRLVIGPGQALTALNAHHFVGAETLKSLDDLVARAARCDVAALGALQAVMPLAHTRVRAAAARPAPPPPMRDGAPALRLLLSLFDE